jgi:hypothetical protein
MWLQLEAAKLQGVQRFWSVQHGNKHSDATDALMSQGLGASHACRWSEVTAWRRPGRLVSGPETGLRNGVTRATRRVARPLVRPLRLGLPGALHQLTQRADRLDAIIKHVPITGLRGRNRNVLEPSQNGAGLSTATTCRWQDA